MSDLFASMVARRPTKERPAAPFPQEGTVIRVVPGGVIFTIKDWDDGVHEFGPAKWDHGPVPTGEVRDAEGVVMPSKRVVVKLDTFGNIDNIVIEEAVSAAPPIGSSCLVVFVGTGIDKPWIVAWTPPGA
jgi:hypothetical protein